MIRIAVVGLGIISKSHLTAIKELSGVKLVAVCDLNEQRAKETSEEYGVPYFLDYKALPTGVDFDAVILNLPHGLHCEATLFFLEAGKHVLLEKPMANTTAECEKMINASKRCGKRLAIAHIQRYFSAIRAVKEFYESHELGTLVMYTENRTIDYFDEKRPVWFWDKKMSGGGIVMNYGAHALDKLFYIMSDAELISLDAQTANVKNGKAIEGHAQIFAKFDNGVSASITFSGYGNFGYESYFYFTNGALRVSNRALEINKADGAGFLPVELGEDKSFVNQLSEFVKYINGEDTSVCDGEYGKRIISTIEKIYGCQSSHNKIKQE